MNKQVIIINMINTIMLTAPASGSGKTTVTMAIIRALRNRGHQPSCFKTGPDYIDTAFLAKASGRSAGNLDLYLQGKTGIRQALSLAESETAVIEGAMGYFDGIANTWIGSSFDISKDLGVPTILIYSPRGELFSAVPKIKGMADFAGGLIKAVILNKVNEKSYLLFKEAIEKYTTLPVIGYMPEVKQSELQSRHLGLIQSIEIEHLEKQIETLASQAELTVDIEALLDIFTQTESIPFPHLRRRNITVAIAMDKAFSFYYRENIKLFADTCSVKFFSPLTDRNLPECDLLYLGGGYPEVFCRELSENRSMLDAIKKYALQGGVIYAECGGMLYLCDTVEDTAMVGVLKGESRITPKLQRFGYVKLNLLKDCLLGKAGSTLTAHEFHRSEILINSPVTFKITKAMNIGNEWSCGYRFKNVLAGYPHLNFLGNLEAFEHMLDYTERAIKNR